MLIESLLEHALSEPVEAVVPAFMAVNSKGCYSVTISDANGNIEGLAWHRLTAQDLLILDRYRGCTVPDLNAKIMVDAHQETVWAYFGTQKFSANIERDENAAPFRYRMCRARS